MSINDFIYYHYEVMFHGDSVNPNDLSDVNEFLLGDTHLSQGHSALNSLFINTYGRPGDVVCVEEVKSMQRINAKQALGSVWIKDFFQVIGCDLSTSSEMMQEPKLQAIAELELEKEVLFKEWIEETNLSVKDQLKERLADIFERCKQERSCIDPESYYDKVIETFPERIKAHQATLAQVEKMGFKKFMILGNEHFISRLNHPNFSLKEFHAFLKQRKVVILFPKSYSVARCGSEREEGIKDIEELIKIRGWSKLIKMFGSMKKVEITPNNP